MTTVTAALDPGETIAAAMRELYDQLREIVDRGPTDDPGLLDELGALTGRIRRRINSARKKAEPTSEASGPTPPVPTNTVPVGHPTASGPAANAKEAADAPTVRLPIITPGGPRRAAPQSLGATPRSREVARVDPPTVPRHRAVSVTTVPARRPAAVTVRIPHDRDGRHRNHRPARLPLWIHALVVLLIVGGIALGTTVNSWGFGMAPAGAAVLAAARRWSIHRPAPATLGGGR
jgi:hypothetical protein